MSQEKTIKYKSQDYPITHPDVFYNCRAKKYVHRNSYLNKGLTLGIIDLKNNEFVYGFFEENPINCARVNDHVNRLLQITNNIEVFLKHRNYSWSRHYNCFTHVDFDADYGYRSAVDKTNYTYNIEDNGEYLFRVDVFNNNKLKIEKELYKYRNIVKNFTYGIEIETASGASYPWLNYKYGFIPCRDGSIEGLEYTSIPYSKLKGLQSIRNFCKENKGRLSTSNACSLHVHIGNIRTDKWFLNALYNFLYSIQNDYYNYFPYSKRVKPVDREKHYTKALIPLMQEITELDFKDKTVKKKIDHNVNTLFKFLTQGIIPGKKYNRKNRIHPKKNKWRQDSRYYLFNFVPLVFSNRKTLEFRIHEQTLNSKEIIHHIILSMIMLNYVSKNIVTCILNKGIKNINDLITHQVKNEELRNELLTYYNNRKNKYNPDNEVNVNNTLNIKNVKQRGQPIEIRFESLNDSNNFYFNRSRSTRLLTSEELSNLSGYTEGQLVELYANSRSFDQAQLIMREINSRANETTRRRSVRIDIDSEDSGPF